MNVQSIHFTVYSVQRFETSIRCEKPRYQTQGLLLLCHDLNQLSFCWCFLSCMMSTVTIAMPTDGEPTTFAKLLHLTFLSTFWGMQIWVTFVSGFVMDNNLSRHTFGFIQSKLFPYYFNLGSACAFVNLTIFAMYHPSELLNEEETLQIVIFFTCVTVAAINAQWFGQMASDVMADMHVIEQSRGLGQDIGQSSNKEAYNQLKEKNTKYKALARQLDLYRKFSSLCNLCCIVCNGLSLYYMAANLSTL